jgi:hypothetical protein
MIFSLLLAISVSPYEIKPRETKMIVVNVLPWTVPYQPKTQATFDIVFN